MIYLMIALAVYAWTAFDIVADGVPETFSEIIALVVLSGVIAAMWPPVIVWRVMLRRQAVPVRG